MYEKNGYALLEGSAFLC